MNLLNTSFTGISLINPFFLAAGPATANRTMISRAFSLGWGGAVIKTLAQVETEPQSNVRPRIQAFKHKNEVIGLADTELGTMHSTEEWLEDIYKLKQEFPDRAVIASILYGGVPIKEQWQSSAKLCQDAGADGLELNFSCPHGGAESGGLASIAHHPKAIYEVTTWVKESSSLPIWVKLPAMPSLETAIKTCLEAGAKAASLINTVAAMPGIDLDTFSPLPSVLGKGCLSGLGGTAIKPIALQAVFQSSLTIPKLPVAGIGGIDSWQSAVEFFLAGAGIVQICSEVMLRGYSIIDELRKGLNSYLKSKNFENIEQIKGLALKNISLHKNLDRAFKPVAENNLQLCKKCGRCFIACRDAGFQAIRNSQAKAPVVNPNRCDGCGLCVQICPAGSLQLSQDS